MNYEKIGDFIALKRKEKRLTQKDLAQKIGLTDKAISKWERGVGCPDVSVLEVLAKELDVSILEILKGQTLEDEVINLKDVNNYVKDTIDYSNSNNKSNLRSVFSKIIMVLIVALVSYLTILNIHHIICLSRKYEYNFTNENMAKIRETVVKIEENVNTIKSSQGIFNDGDYNNIIDMLDSDLPTYKNIPILKFNGVKKFNLNDIYILDLSKPPRINVPKIFELLMKYDVNIESYYNLDKTAYTLIYLLSGDNYLELDTRYRYQLVDLFNYGVSNYNDSMKKIKIFDRIMHYSYYINSYYYLTELIIEVGEINA